MSKNYYLPRKDADKELWLKNFADKLSKYATKYSILPAEVTATQQDKQAFSYWLNAVHQHTEQNKNLVAYKNELKDGVADGASPSIVPVVALPAGAVNVAPGIFKRATALGNRIKAHKDYTLADGEDLGLEGSTIATTDPQTLKPVLKLRLISGGRPEIVWQQNGADSLEIWVDRDDDTGFHFLAIDTRPNYTDKHELPAKAEKWQYKAIYKIDDEQVGSWSDIMSISVVAGLQ